MLEIRIVVDQYAQAAEHVQLLFVGLQRLQLARHVVVEPRRLGHPQRLSQAKTIEEGVEAGGDALSRRGQRLALAVQEAVEEGQGHGGGGAAEHAAKEKSAI